MSAVLVAAIILLLALGTGGLVAVPLTYGQWRRSELLVLSAAVGLGIVAYLTWLLGLLGLLHRNALLACGAVLTPAAVLGCIGLRRRRSEPVRQGDAGVSTGGTVARYATVAAIGLVGVAFAVPLIDCFVPPGAHEWDSLSYHLAVPSAYLRAHRVVELPTDHHSYFPFLTQMLYTAALAFDGFAAAKLLHWAFGLLSCAATFMIARRLMPVNGAWLAAVMFAWTPMIMWEAGIAYIELAQTLYVAVTFLALIILTDRKEPSTGVLPGAAVAGVCAGLALAVKTISLVPVTAAIVVAIWMLRRARPVMALIAATLLVGAPFYVRTWLLTGNPVYPFAYSVFGGKNWDSERARLYAGEHTSFGLDARLPALADDLRPVRPAYVEPSLGDRLRNLALAPFSLVAMPRIFHNYNDPSPFMNLGFLWLAFVPLALLQRSMDPRIGVLLAVLAFWYVTWSFSMQYARYLIPAVPLLGVVGSWGALRLAVRSRAIAAVAVAAIAVQCTVAAAHALPRAAFQAGLAVSPEASQEHIARQVNVYRSQQWLNSHTRPDEGVVLFEETRGFYLDRPVLWGNAPHSAYIPYEMFKNGRDMAAWFVKRGHPYALINLQFAPQAATAEGAAELRRAVSAGAEASLLLSWYSDSSATSDHWRWLIGDAVRSGAASVVADASERGAVVLRFGDEQEDSR